MCLFYLKFGLEIIELNLLDLLVLTVVFKMFIA